jgi:hypothetical protein
MQLSNEEEDYNLSLSKFESMLKTNKVLIPKNLKKSFFIISIWVRQLWQKHLNWPLINTQNQQD